MNKKLKEELFSLVKQLKNPNVKRLFDNLIFEKQSAFVRNHPNTAKMLNDNNYFWGVSFRRKDSIDFNTIFVRDDKETMLFVNGSTIDYSLLFIPSDIKRSTTFAVLKSICKFYNVKF